MMPITKVPTKKVRETRFLLKMLFPSGLTGVHGVVIFSLLARRHESMDNKLSLVANETFKLAAGSL